jgi:hypothetical protein
MRKTLSISMGLLLAAAPAARAGERVTLSNGFELRCNHHAEFDGRVRLFNDKGEDSYIEFGPEEIAGFEQVPDPPEPAPTAADGAAAAPALPANSQKAELQLSPEDLRQILSKAGHEHNVDVDLLASVVKAESGGNVHAVSPKGARGLMQLMPATAADLGVDDSFQPEQNVRGGATYLDALLTYYHNNLALALAAYNAGPVAVAKYRGMPPYYETRAYVARVIHEFNRRVRARQTKMRLTASAAVTAPVPSSR